jgi:hypothetical protein
MSGQAATRETVMLSGVLLIALFITAIIAGYAIFAIFGSLLESGGAINTLNNGS